MIRAIHALFIPSKILASPVFRKIVRAQIAFMKHIEYQNGSTTISIPVAENYRDCVTLIRSDFYRNTGVKMSLLKMWFKSLNYPILGFNFWLRMSSYNGILYLYSRMRLRRYSRKYGLQIHPKCKIGYGLYIGHGFGTIVNKTAIIGNNVNLSQFTTIGSNRGQAAIIGDNVYLGPSVCLVENIHIGNNASVGAGAVVVKDVPENATVAGVPAKVISYNTPGRFINRRWDSKWR